MPMYSKTPACLITAFFVLLTGCAEEPKVKKEEKPPEPVSALKAFYTIYSNARTWATDAQVLDINSVDLDEKHMCKEGKCWAWSVNLVSPSKGKLKNYTYSVIEWEGNLHQGVFSSLDENFRGSRGQEKPFLMQAMRKDSTDAYKVAVGKSGDYIKKHPEVPITYEISYTPKYPQPAYRIIWGDSVATSAYSVLVDAATGEYAETLH